MFKIPPSLGDQNINLTTEYVQEEDEDPTQVKVEEERQQFNLLVSDLFSKIPNHKNIGRYCMNWH